MAEEKMIAFAFAFIAGRYHATPWGRHANEADVAWPPEPVRILRALIATWWRKLDHQRFPKPALDDLVEALARELPLFHLPKAVHSHLRSFMPAPTERKLIFDSFLRLETGAEMIAAWPAVTLTAEQRELAAHLLKHMAYLGRAESWAEARIADEWSGEANAYPQAQRAASSDLESVELLAPLTPACWAEWRAKLIAKPTRMKASKRALIEATLPDRLADALALDTSDWLRVGWSTPPPLCKIVYERPPIGAPPPLRQRKASLQAVAPARAEVARFVLAGRPQPRIEQALRIGEVARWALMAGGGDPPPEFSGRDAAGPRRDDPAHAHAFFLPEDADGDGFIDHLIVYCRLGFSPEARRRLDRLHSLWLARGAMEWRVALEDIAVPETFTGVSALLRPSRLWASITPYLMPWYAKRDFGVAEQVTQELARRAIFPRLQSVTVLDRSVQAKPALNFDRFRSRRGLSQPDRLGTPLSLTFAEAVQGPLALGFACHYGLGLFVAIRGACSDR
jgi:CRISPR-associated protein Csb2